MVSDEIFPIGKEVPEEADDGMILRNRISGAELSGSAPVVLSYVLRVVVRLRPGLRSAYDRKAEPADDKEYYGHGASCVEPLRPGRRGDIMIGLQ